MLANLINSLLIYKDAVSSDNPQLRVVDWTRKQLQILLKSATSKSSVLYPGETQTLFDGTRTNPLDGTSVLTLSLFDSGSSLYRITVTSGTSGFRTARLVSGIDACTVTVNNSAAATFTFTAATLTGVVVGDTMRIRGQLLNDTAPYAFNPLNAGLWKIIGISGNAVTVIRFPCKSFSAAPEVVAHAAADVIFYSAAGIQAGDKMSIEGTFSVMTQRIYEVKDATPTTIDFVSAMPLPLETVTYIPSTITFYVSSKKLIYIETDQESVVRVNNDVTDNNKVTPFASGDSALVGFYQKVGDTYKIAVVNKSVNTMAVQYILGE